MPLTLSHWHDRYTQQAGWTRQLRQHLYQRFNLAHARRILDVGCGTGALLTELLDWGKVEVHGLDIQAAHLQAASHHAPGAHLVLADAHHLPYPNQSFDATFCHFVLLWVHNPAQVLSEMRRLTRSKGTVLAFAEPDYGGQIAYPPKLAELGAWQAEALQQQGANPYIGRRLRQLFKQAGLTNIEMGVLGGQWAAPLTEQEWEMEWAVIESDLAWNPDHLRRARQIKTLDELAWQRDERVLFVPTCYAYGQVP